MIFSDVVVIGAGIYGLYAAMILGKQGRQVTVLEMDPEAFCRATYVNQARVHQGYHYPRSLHTASKSAGYFERFLKDYSFCIYQQFEKIYGISSQFSMTDGTQFSTFCKAAGIPFEEINPSRFFQNNMCEAAFLTREFTYDASLLRQHFLNEIQKLPSVKIKYSSPVRGIETNGTYYLVSSNGEQYETPFVVNTTYASVNQVMKMVQKPSYEIKYELCEIILCKVESALRKYGITVMDGPFFSIMPFGMTGFHSLTSVTFTPHATSYKDLPEFACMNKENSHCSPDCLNNCNQCPNHPVTAFPYMAQLARKYLCPELSFTYEKSLYSMKPILKAAEVDDSRPTLINQVNDSPRFISVLSGKINTIYDLDDILAEKGNV